MSAFSTFLAVFVLVINGWAGSKYEVLHAFTGGADGGGIFAGVVLDAKGNLYGMSSGGGAYGEGTVFKLSASTQWSESVLHSFCAPPKCSDGGAPSSGLIFDASGNLYGTARGGTNNSGVAFELTPDPVSSIGWKFVVLYDSGSDVSLVLDEIGNLYGIGGPGKHKAGAVVELSRGTGGWKEMELHSFCAQRPDCRDGEPPEWGLGWDSVGNLYGTTEFGGGNNAPQCSIGCGVVYQVEDAGGGKWKYHVLHRFAAFPQDGLMPQAGVTVDSKGNVYGTTLYSGTSSGTVFELSPQQGGRWKETILYDFPNPLRNGGAPVGGVTFDNVGNLYGTASAGGDPVCSCGVVFKMTPQPRGKWIYSMLHRFTGEDGYGPGSNLVFDKSYKHLYGTTAAGGSGGYGVVYEITP
jgi:uncharacterized repeat protein (TIGR03803 family)